MVSNNKVVAMALNAMSNEEANAKIEKAFDTAMKSSLETIEKELAAMIKTKNAASVVFNNKPEEFKTSYKALTHELSSARVLLHLVGG